MWEHMTQNRIQRTRTVKDPAKVIQTPTVICKITKSEHLLLCIILIKGIWYILHTFGGTPAALGFSPGKNWCQTGAQDVEPTPYVVMTRRWMYKSNLGEYTSEQAWSVQRKVEGTSVDILGWNTMKSKEKGKGEGLFMLLCHFQLA